MGSSNRIGKFRKKLVEEEVLIIKRSKWAPEGQHEQLSIKED